MRYNAMAESFEEVTVLGRPMLFSDFRIDRGTVPKGLYMYEVRHDDSGRGDPCEISKCVAVNFFGTLISSRPVRLESCGKAGREFREIDPEKDWGYEGADSTLSEYMERHPPREKGAREHER